VPSAAPFRLRYTAVSDVGRHRKENQDSGYASERLLVIADGVGGAAYGDVASSTAVTLLRRLDGGTAATSGDEALPALAGAVHRIHDRLAEMVEQDHELDGTSTTVTAALFDGHRFALAHVGDSRAYLMRDGTLQQLTKDHTFVQTLVDDGRITEAESRVHPHRNIILKAVDGVHEPEPDLFLLEAQAGDRVLLCSDGCSGVLDDAQLAHELGGASIDAAAVGLVHASLDNGTTDNVTVVLAEVVATGDEDDPETSAAVSVGPMLVGAASEQPRRGGLRGRGRLRGRGSGTVATVDPDTEDADAGSRDDGPDTSELEPVEGDTADPEQLRYAPRPPRRFMALRRILLVLTAVLLLAGVAAAAYAWSQQQYYVAVDGSGVAIYRGVQVDLPLVQLSSVEESAGLEVDDLAPWSQEQVREGIVADDLADARRIIADLEAQAGSTATEGAGG
jgi:protein phosphatase